MQSFLQRSVSTNYNALFLAITGLLFYQRANATSEASEKKAYKEAAFTFVLWGLYLAVVSFILSRS